MKKNSKKRILPLDEIPKNFWRKMRVTLLLCLVTIFQVTASNLVAQKKISLSMQDVSLEEVFGELRKQTGDIIVFNTQMIKANNKITVQYKNQTLTSILDDLLAGSDLGYKVLEDYIIIYKQEQPVQPQSKKRTVKGKVTDEKGEPIIGANVWVKETSVGVATNANGEYSLSFEGTYPVLMASFIGYKNQEAVIGNRSQIDFQLVPESEKLDEVVVVGYGTQKKESVIGSISTIKNDNLKLPTAKLSTGLAGQLAGIISVQRSGEPGSGSNFWIRGVSTFGANKTPLVLVDGIERSLDYVDPEDIESFSILKDATATAVYGVRGANGVVLITTRKGEEGRPKIAIRAEAGLTGPTQMPEMVNSVQFAELYNEAFKYEHGSPFYTQDIIDKYAGNVDADLYPNVNWIKELYKKFSSNQRVNVNVSGGGAIARYYISGSFYNEGSIFKEDNMKEYDSSINYKKFNFRSNVDISLSQSTILNVNLANIYEKKDSPGAATGNIWSYTFLTSPNAFPVKYSDGHLSAPQGTGSNPYNLLTQSGYCENFWNTAQALIGLTQDFSGFVTEGLKANIKFSWDAHNSNEIKREGNPQTWTAIGRDAQGNLEFQEINKGQSNLNYSKSNGGHRIFYLEASLSYNRVFANTHRIGALFLYNQKELNYVAAGSSEEALPYRNQGIAARVTYSYDDRYFLEANCGYNGSENFSPGNRFGFFPAVALGWMVSNEKFFTRLTPVIDLLKLKGSYGVVGNDQIGGGRRFIYNETINGSAPGYSFGKNHTDYGGVQIRDFANPDVSWEEAYKLNLGVELSFFRKLKINADYFKEKRRGIFMQRSSIPGLAGITTMPWVNVGKVDNQGFDGSLEYEHRIGELTVSARANFTYNRNKVVDNDQPDWKYKYQNRIGKPIDQQWGLIADGLFRSQSEIDNWAQQSFGDVRVGDIKYKDINGDGIIDSYDEVAIGRSSIPEMVYGFGVSLKWKGLDLSAFFQGIGHTTFFMNGSAVRPFTNGNMYRASMYEEVYNNRWNPANPDPNAEWPRLSTGNNLNNYRNSTYWQRNGSFLRLKNAELGYTLPKKFTSRIHLENVRFYLSGLNLLTFSKFKLWDPEMGGGHGEGYPPNRIFNFGISVNI